MSLKSITPKVLTITHLNLQVTAGWIGENIYNVKISWTQILENNPDFENIVTAYDFV